MIHGDMKASATSWRRRAERRRLRRRSATRACSRAAAGRSAMVAMSWASAQLELVGDLLLDLLQPRLEVRDLAGLPLLGEGAEQVGVGLADRGDRFEGRGLVGEDVE